MGRRGSAGARHAVEDEPRRIHGENLKVGIRRVAVNVERDKSVFARVDEGRQGRVPRLQGMSFRLPPCRHLKLTWQS